jgi:hypothetical protein
VKANGLLEEIMSNDYFAGAVAVFGLAFAYLSAFCYEVIEMREGRGPEKVRSESRRDTSLGASGSKLSKIRVETISE